MQTPAHFSREDGYLKLLLTGVPPTVDILP
jgi:hypothetical protein